MDRISPAAIRYIKLGEKGKWENQCLERGEIQADFLMVPHETALSGDRDAIRLAIKGAGYGPGSASRLAAQLLDFYQLGSDCLWFTFARGHLWWGFAEPKVHWLGGDRTEHGGRMRKIIGGWKNTAVLGRPLQRELLSTALTRVAMGRNTIADGERYREKLLNLINDETNPVVLRGQAAEADLRSALSDAIPLLHQDDFETLLDLVFARSGWHRVSRLGGYQPDLDLALEQSVTGERAFVQVKSEADASKLHDVVERFRAYDSFDRCFFVCHTSGQELTSGDPDVTVWNRAALAEHAVRSGLASWVLQRVS